VVASDSRLYRDGLREMLSREVYVAVVDAVDGYAACKAAVRASSVDVVLLDMAMPDSRETSRKLVDQGVKIVGLEVEDVDEEIIANVEAGMVAYVTRSASVSDLVSAVEGAVRGEATCSPRVTATLLERIAFLAAGQTQPASLRLTAREWEVLGLIEVGFSNKEIAQQLCIQVATVKNHVHNILEKLDVKGRGEAGSRARKFSFAHHGRRRLRV